jgi:hypothetical protein
MLAVLIDEPLLKSNIFVALVVCSLEESRNELDKRTIINLSEVIPKELPDSDFLVFDNGSTDTSNLDLLSNTRVIRCEKNYGYWSALNWILNSHLKNNENQYDYIYIVESDIIHESLNKVHEIASLMDINSAINHARTQIFSRINRFYFDKRYSFLPPKFHDHANHVSYFNEVTKKKAIFRVIPGSKNIFYSNLHPKLPGLHRIDSMQKIFEKLSRYEFFTENDFYKEALKLSNEILILSPGIWHTSASPLNKKIFTGSYSNISKLNQIGYSSTRSSSIREINPKQIQIDEPGR